jgi:hypothetical protein
LIWAWRKRGWTERPDLRLDLRLDLVPDRLLDLDAVEARNFLQAGRRGHVDLGEVVADHVDAHEEQAPLSQIGADGGADVMLARGERAFLRPAADMHVGTCVARGGHAVDGAHGLAIDEDDALVALPHGGLVALDHQRLGGAGEVAVEDRAEILVILADAEDPDAAIAEQRLDDDVAKLRPELGDGGAVPGDERRRHQIGEVRDQQLLGRVADGGRVVHHQRLGVDMLQHVGGGDIGHVEGRVLPHQDHVHRAEVEPFGGAEGEVVSHLAPQDDGVGPRGQPLATQRHVADLVVPELVAARLGFEHECEGRVSVDLDGLHRVHLDGDFQRSRHRHSPRG